VSERRVNLEKDDVQTDPTVESGKADTSGARLSEERIPRPKLLRIDQLKAVDIDQPTVGDL
jgi:hypothetical protein